MSTTRSSRRAAPERHPIFEVLVIDDETSLAESLPMYMKRRTAIVPTFTFLTKVKRVEELDSRVREADAILLDHKIGNRYAGFRNGLAIGKRIVKIRNDIPIYYYSAYNDLLRGGATDASSREVKEFAARKNVRVFGKGDLAPNRRLDELCAGIQDDLQAKLEKTKENIVDVLAKAQVIGRERKAFRIDHFDKRRKYQEVRNLDDAYAPTIEISTSVLKGLSIEGVANDVVLEVCQFSSGHVVSSFSTQPRQVSPDVIRLLEEES